jgi:hypothetical protein
VAAGWAVAAFNLLPSINLLALHFGPVLPALTAWVWFLAAVVRASQAGQEQVEEPWAWWWLAGAVWAVGLLFSYWLVVAFIFLPFLLWRRRRFSLARLGGVLWVAFCGLLGLLGPLLWQIETSWIALSRQTWVSLRAWGGGASLEALMAWASGCGWLGALALLAAVGLVLLGRGVPRAFLAGRLGAGVFLLLGLWAFWNGRELPLVHLAWGTAALAGAAIWLARKESAVYVRRWGGLMVGLACLLAGLGSFWVLLHGQALEDEPPWAEITPRLQRALSIHQAAGSEPLFLVTDRGENAAALAYHISRGREVGLVPAHFPPVFVRESQNVASQFALWPRYDEFVSTDEAPDPFFSELRATNPFLGRHALYLAPEDPKALPQVITNGFERVIPLEVLRTGGGDFYLYLCENYQTAPL